MRHSFIPENELTLHELMWIRACDLLIEEDIDENHGHNLDHIKKLEQEEEE